MSKKTYGIIGFPLSHSFSNNYFTEKFVKQNLSDCTHKVFPISTISKFPDCIENEPELLGLNVTIPYKQLIIPYLDELDETAKAVGAVNTIKIIRTASSNKTKLIGYNSDVFGFANALKPFLKNNHQRALILGTGGAAKAVAFVLKHLGIDYFFVSRTNNNTEVMPNETVFSYDELNENHFATCHLVVNCTPLGMFPNVDACPPIPYQHITESHLLFDLIYNPDETLFLQKGKAKGALTQNGLTMLYLQAEESWRIWNEN